MPAIRNTCVARGIISSAGYFPVYTVPVGFAFILKSYLVYNAASGQAHVNQRIADPVSGAAIFLSALTLAAAAFSDWSGWTVLNAGDQVDIQTDAVPVHYWVAGAVLPFAP